MSYIGTQVNNVKKNSGIYTPNEILQLEKEGSWGGSSELITSNSSDNSAQTLEFNNCLVGEHDVYLIQWKNFVPANDENMLYFRLKNASGEISSGYQYAGFYNTATGGSGEDKSTSATYLRIMGGGGSSTGENANGHIYIYGASTSERTAVSYSSSYIDQNALYQNIMGGGVYDTAEVTTGVMFRSISSGGTLGNINTLDVSIYGIKKI
tara:strand:+ start:281 stop:907 length:627 start_codon:yes stop_codon:yes gene_type:complete